MPVIKDLIVDMDAVHWKKIQRVTPWLLPEGDPPEREYVVPMESMIDVTQTMACIQCGACVSDCLSMEVDPLFIGPAALAKAYRFVGDPRDGQHDERLKDLAEDPHGIYDCTHCFNCIEACPKGVAPMSQIMRLRRIAGSDYEIDDRNNGHRHEKAFVKNIEKNGLLHEADLLPDSYGGKFHPRAVPELLELAARDPQGAPARQGDAEEGAAAPAQGGQGRQADLRAGPRQGRALRAQPLRRGLRGRRAPRRGASEPHEGRLLARLREPRLHARAARLDGEGRPAAGHRARRARPRVLHAAPA